LLLFRSGYYWSKIPIVVRTFYNCSLSLWRVGRGSKHMFLELIHGLFITLTEFRLSTTFIPIIIIMHIYNWYHSITTSILSYTRDDIDCMYTIIPLAPLAPLVRPSSLTWNPPCCDRIRLPHSRVARKLTPHFPHLPHVAPYLKSRPPGVFQIQIDIH
jgi:hypothetical protein